MAILQECPICKKRQKTATKVCPCGHRLDRAKRSGRVKFWIDYYLPGGKQRRELVGTSIEDARAAEGKRRGQKKEGRIFDMLPDSKKTFADLAAWFLASDRIQTLASYKGIVRHVALFNETFGGRLITHLTREELQGFQVTMKAADYSNSYTDQVIDTARWMITEALDNGLIGGDCLKPFRKLKKLLRKDSNARRRVLSPAEYQALYDALPGHLKAILAAGWWSGMRQGEILRLTWDRVDLAGRLIHLAAADTKEGRPKLVPIAKPLRDILLTLPGRAAEGYVFTYAGRPVRDITQGIESGCRAAGIAYGRFAGRGFVFHDLRRGFVTYARKAGVPRNVIMAITGHSSGRGDMNRRYDQVDPVDLLDAVDRLERLFSTASIDLSIDQTAEKA